KAFSARRYAPNFDHEQMARAADYLHVRGKKLYVTVNTLIKETELPAVLEEINYLYSLGVDGIIIQDLGVAALARELWPDLPLHASTQMTVHDAAGVRFLQEAGFKRVVLARELSLAEIETIKETTCLELEVFIHGALCVCYSGACLFSSMVGGRSGNRGACTQPCRMEYELLQDGQAVQTQPGARSPFYPLSTKDLFLLPYLAELAAAGVTSLKIEGRMKSHQYVAAVTQVYRQALNRLAEDPQVFRMLPEEEKAAHSVFNRGLSPGYLKGDPGPDLSAANRPSNRGFFAGRVKEYDRECGCCRVALVEELAEGDEIEIWTSKGGRRRVVLRELVLAEGKDKTEAIFSLAEPVQPGDRVFLVNSRRRQLALQQLLRDESGPGKVACRMTARVAPGAPLTVTIDDYQGHTATVSSAGPAQAASKHPLTPEVLREHLSRMGDTPFTVREFYPEITGKPMLAFGRIHQVRREAVAALSEARLAGSHRLPLARKALTGAVAWEKGSVRRGPSYLVVFAGDLATVEAAAGLAGVPPGIARIIFGGESFLPGAVWDETSLALAVAACRQARISPVLALPRITRERERGRVETYLEVARTSPPDGVLVSHAGSYQLAKEETDLPLYINYPLYTFNTAAGFFWAGDPRVRGFTFSPELSAAELEPFFTARRFSGLELEILVFAALELMVSQFCLVGAFSAGRPPDACNRPCRHHRYELRDKKGYLFPLVCDEFCRCHLMNSHDLSLLGELPVLREKGVGLRLDLRFYRAPVAARLITLFQKALEDGVPRGGELWQEVTAITGRKTTRGHYRRGVE
ncbi:MAG: U32 family peptidase, partial [Clostridia bacterium]|nr:U32 family peptidase [Clostridia bacterium]